VRPEQGDRGAEGTVSPVPPKPHPVVVERITHADVPAICTLLKKVGDAQPAGLPAELLKAWQPAPLEFTSQMEGVTYFAARRDGRLIGAIGCEIRHGTCHLMVLAVDPETRRQGVASALLGAATEWAKRSNAPSIWVDALARFTPVAAFLRRHGYSEAGALHKHEWGEDIALFERVL
jgi:GNAT superfamily N-acetyltransferase